MSGNAGRVRVRAGTTLGKSGTNIVAFNATTLQLDGAINVQAGTLQLENGTVILSNRGSAWQVQSGAVLALSSSSDSLGVTLTGSIDLHGGTLRSSAFTQTVASPVTLSATGAEFNAAGQLNMNGAIGGVYQLSKTGTGVLRLANAANSYSGGTNVLAGTLWVDNISTTNGVTGAGPSPSPPDRSGGQRQDQRTGHGRRARSRRVRLPPPASARSVSTRR